MNEKQPEQIDRAQILLLAELVREQAENSYNADRQLTFSEMALISRSCDEIGREISKPERQHAHWVKFGNSGGDYSDRWQCSGCKQTARAETWGRVCEYERCPHCGAIMGEYDDDDGSGVGQTFSPD